MVKKTESLSAQSQKSTRPNLWVREGFPEEVTFALRLVLKKRKSTPEERGKAWAKTLRQERAWSSRS